jgi:hypothetical protein
MGACDVVCDAHAIPIVVERNGGWSHSAVKLAMLTNM